MINEIRSGIISALHAAFGNEIAIYEEPMREDANGPCFFVQCTRQTGKRVVGRRFQLDTLFTVQYVPGTTQKQAECMQVLMSLYGCLELIRAGADLIRGSQMSGEYSSQVLNFYINYDFFAYEEAITDPSMKDMKINNTVKG